MNFFILGFLVLNLGLLIFIMWFGFMVVGFLFCILRCFGGLLYFGVIGFLGFILGGVFGLFNGFFERKNV